MTIEDETQGNFRDLFLIGLSIGQRISDLIGLQGNEPYTNKNGIRCIDVVQSKTGKMVTIPLHGRVEKVLQRYGGKVPILECATITAKIEFNRRIKEICRLAGITEKMQGEVMNPETRRKEEGVFEKWQLITSHTCRRSFATNMYGKFPTYLVMSVTGRHGEAIFGVYRENQHGLRDRTC